MKLKISLFFFVLAAASCTGKQQNTADTLKVYANNADTSSANPVKSIMGDGEYCFLRTDGTKAQDSTKVHLVVKNHTIMGEMNWLPKEKDSRKGSIKGTIQQNIIKAVWIFMQEGMKDTMAVEFKITPQQLDQKPNRFNASIGREELNPKARYTITFDKADCITFKKIKL